VKYYLPKGISYMDIQLVGIIGAGVMGSGLAQVLAKTGHEVVLVDISNDILQSIKDQFIKNVRLQMMLSKEHAIEEPRDVLKTRN
jgi:3-hydroxybutyryl-CoA dehydrogenase